MTPLPYATTDERIAPDEAETNAALIETLRGILDTTSADYDHAVRAVHAKSHGLIEGELRVLDHLPPILAQGMFSAPCTFGAVIRLSTNPGDLLDDSVSAPRGLALKIIGVEGARLPGSADASTQDFVMANAPAFSAPDTKAFLGSVKLLAKTTDTPQVFKKLLSAAARGAEAVVEAVGGKSATLTSLGGQPLTHILGDTYYTQVPIRYGDHVAKLRLSPMSPELRALNGTKISVSGRPDALRDAVNEFLATHGAVWELAVQLRTDATTMPIEDASVPWPEDASPYVAVAHLTTAPQTGWSPTRAATGDDKLAFSPWHGLEAHRPLGGIMRARKPTYEMSAQFRSQFNRCPIHEPHEGGVLPG